MGLIHHDAPILRSVEAKVALAPVGLAGFRFIADLKVIRQLLI